LAELWNNGRVFLPKHSNAGHYLRFSMQVHVLQSSQEMRLANRAFWGDSLRQVRVAGLDISGSSASFEMSA
jgi:hypothetical protein